ncbi:Profilin domain-containing protein [Rozella allomycis CSF55]|uniref:Profilin n=1 Tax=Rozella allomycis (strain CSF55) TaxID=988480 RepID=A0A075AY61_ROZAC|nr:Profilin domain-containing protein [Rozella allomycis CSF55]|eukprot:EPZ35069.1 Profilin domain-containing protein [Rozella allomycis CSF55]
MKVVLLFVLLYSFAVANSLNSTEEISSTEIPSTSTTNIDEPETTSVQGKRGKRGRNENSTISKPANVSTPTWNTEITSTQPVETETTVSQENSHFTSSTVEENEPTGTHVENITTTATSSSQHSTTRTINSSSSSSSNPTNPVSVSSNTSNAKVNVSGDSGNKVDTQNNDGLKKYMDSSAEKVLSSLNFIQDGLLSTQHVRNAAIIKRSDGLPKAKSAGFDIDLTDFDVVEYAFEHPKDIQDTGIRINDVVYTPVRLDSFSIYAKSVDKGGAIIARTDNYYIVSLYDNGMAPGIAVEATEKMAEYFRVKGK